MGKKSSRCEVFADAVSLALLHSPNLVTTFSFLHAIFAHLLIQWYSPNLSELAPNWAYPTVAVCMFLYQTLDAIDGKQARRTKNGSPLGQLFDHGCDAVTAWIMGIFVAATMRCGPTATSFVLMMMVVVPFFAANWEESCTSVFRFGVVGVTEGQFIVMGVMLLSGIVGPELWQRRVFADLLGMEHLLPWLTVFHMVIGTGVIGGTYQVVSSIWVVWNYYTVHHPRESRDMAIKSFVQFFLGIALMSAWVLAPSGAMVNHPRILLCVCGALCSYQCSRLIICHTTGERYSKWWVIMYPLPFIVLNEWSGRLFHGKDSQLWVDQYTTAWAYAIFTVAFYAHFIQVTIHQITTFLGIKCFKIKPVTQGPPPLADPHSLDEKNPEVTRKVFGKAR
jgi:ethanolaminephosphotransferase